MPDDDDVISETVNYEDKKADAPAPEPAEENALAQPAAEQTAAEGAEADGAPEANAEHAEGDEGHHEEDQSADKATKPQPKGNAWQKRVDKLTKEKHDALRQLEEMKARVALQEAQEAPAEAAQPQPSQANQPPINIEQLVEQRVQQKAFEQRFQDWEGKGKSEFPDFTDRCNTLAQLGATERPEFVPALLEIENGHKIAAQLAQNEDEAVRILSLPTYKMIAELTKMGLEAGKPKGKAVSKAPPPIRPVDGSAQVTDEILPDDSEEEMYRKWEAADKKKRMQRYGQL